MREAVSLLRAATPTRGRLLPAFLVIGTKRGGSTSLYDFMVQHPRIARSRAYKGTHYFDVNHHKGQRWFRSFFVPARDGLITGEASPYYMFHPWSPRWIAQELPDVKLIAALRDPVARAYSHYWAERRRGFEAREPERAFAEEAAVLPSETARLEANPNYQSFAHRHHSYLARGRYAEQLDHVFAFVARNRVLLVESEALLTDANAMLSQVWTFLGVEPFEIADTVARKQGDYDEIPDSLRAWLEDYFRPFNAELARMVDVPFSWLRAVAGSPTVTDIGAT